MRRSRFELAKEKVVKETKTGPYGNIIPLIKQGKVIPIISNSFYIEQIFAEEIEATDQIPEATQDEKLAKKDNGDGVEKTLDYLREHFDRENFEVPWNEVEVFIRKVCNEWKLKGQADEDLTSDQMVTMAWAEFINYPMPVRHDLARVAQYHLVEEAKEKVTSYLARAKYINFMKEFTLRVFEDEEGFQDIANELKSVVGEKLYSEIVSELGLPKYSNSGDNPLRLLASLPLPFYVTTSYYDFLERALIDVNKEPITQVCFWSGNIKDVRPEHKPNNAEPTVNTPLVYHLYGLEDYPETLVLSEDDYMNFLIKVMGHMDKLNPIVPLRLTEALAESQLLLLGYQIRDVDFRILFRLLSKFRQSGKQMLEKGMVIQQKKLTKKEMGDVDKTLDYLREYFDQENFEVKWKEVEDFIRELCREFKSESLGEQNGHSQE